MSLPYVSLLKTSLSLALLVTALPCLTGCLVLDSGSSADVPVVVNNLKIKVRSGQKPVVGASIQLYEADLTSYTGTSAARLPSPVVTGKDGNYVASTVLICNPKSLFYLVATGGNAGGGDSSATALMTAVGSCDDLATSSIVLNEATTVASAYALSGFMNSITSVSANATVGTNNGTKLALTGITNAFHLVRNLVDIHTGASLAVTAAGNGTVPQAKINSLANVLAACIESVGLSSTACTGLTTNAPSLSGVAPTDTLQAALNIAHNPGAHVAALYALSSAGPFAPVPTAVPNDLTLSILYKGTGAGNYQTIAADSDGHIWTTASSNTNAGLLTEFNVRGKVENTYSGGSTGITSPLAIAIDPSNNVWVQNCSGACKPAYGAAPATVTYSLVKIGNGGSPITSIPQGSTGLISSTMFDSTPYPMASDGQGDIYALNPTAPGGVGIVKYAPDGTLASGKFPLTYNSFRPSGQIAINGSGTVSVFISELAATFFDGTGNLTRSVSFGFSNGASLTYTGTAFDHAGDLFQVGSEFYSIAGKSFDIFSNLTPTGTTLFPGAAYSPGGLDFPNAIIVDGAGTQWIANNGVTNVSAFTSAGTAFSPNSPDPGPPFFSLNPKIGGFEAGFSTATAIAVDISGNVWISDGATPTLAEYVGAATPVTPLSVGVRDDTVGQRP
ncbi:NHL repeat-containing protein [Granulicella arctica]|uniref:hypothetical protein n=1 Tax=Granulicella arctica TaxID=940613 RepID=UPI0021E0C3C6|nr:hypothetical protein [Granulicella arctica]